MIIKSVSVFKAEVLTLGNTFNKNWPDLHNTQIVDVVTALKGYNFRVNINDFWDNSKN